jgi:hypothetical protein
MERTVKRVQWRVLGANGPWTTVATRDEARREAATLRKMEPARIVKVTTYARPSWAQLATAKAVHEAVVLERDGLERDVATLTEALASSRAGHERAKAELFETQADLSQRKADCMNDVCNRQLADERDAALADVARLTAERDRWEAKARQGLSMLNDEVGVSISLRADVARLTDTLSCLKSFDHEVAQRISDEVIALRAEVFRLRLDYGKAKAERDEWQRMCARAECRLDKEDWPVAKECESLYAKLGKVLAEVARLTKELDIARSDRELWKGRVEGMRRAVGEMPPCGATHPGGSPRRCEIAAGHPGMHWDRGGLWPVGETKESAMPCLGCPRCTFDGSPAPADDGLLHDRVHVPGGGLIKATPINVSAKPATCVHCGLRAEGNYSIHLDDSCEGPEVPLCDSCGGHETPTCDEIWARIAKRTEPAAPAHGQDGEGEK